MGCREMQAQQKRLSRPGVSLDHLDRPIAEQVRHVANSLNRDLLLVELAREPGYRELVGLEGVRTMVEIVCAAAEDSEELIVAALQRTEIRQRAEMPFADQRGAIARLLQQ